MKLVTFFSQKTAQRKNSLKSWQQVRAAVVSISCYTDNFNCAKLINVLLNVQHCSLDNFQEAVLKMQILTKSSFLVRICLRYSSHCVNTFEKDYLDYILHHSFKRLTFFISRTNSKYKMTFKQNRFIAPAQGSQTQIVPWATWGRTR